MGISNKDNYRSTSNTLYSKNKVIKHSRDCSQSNSLEISKKYKVCYIFFEILNVFVLKTRIGAHADHKENKYRKQSFRRKTMVSRRTTRPGKKKKGVISLWLNLSSERGGIIG
jgi:hypothetical protein